MQPALRSPNMSEKSLVTDAPSINRKNTEPINQGSGLKTDLTVDQPATKSSSPLGTAIVKAAQNGYALNRSGGME